MTKRQVKLKLKMKNEMKLALEIMMEKYHTLVWFARSNPYNEKIQPRIIFFLTEFNFFTIDPPSKKNCETSQL